MEKKYLKISKESVWWVIKHIKHIIGIFILYIIYLKFMPLGIHEIIIHRIPFIEFAGLVVVLSLILWCIYVILVELVGTIIRWGATAINPRWFEGIPEFTIKIPITKSKVEEFDKKFKRKVITGFDKPEKEFDYDFCFRIINKIIEEKLKGGKDERKR
jgi:hypothetical protein